ncbi:inter-alpha-trypsin inhibitor heavy chain H3-like [Saccostrea echinata]|uniref:inter-alpha-trypsin inhibitor heavy chain H3-like n=1 Tax=Saccostrea echinata TaxID=191078 RepID=UPI002A81D2CD|nr:inter-alpha-trypsin inhibitor heavy chain H3-like [Saccostrea echinata]
MWLWNFFTFFAFHLYVFGEDSIALPPQITEMAIVAKTFARFSEVTVTTVVKNTNNKSHEVMFAVQVPMSGFISGFQMTTNNKTLRGLVQEKSVADKSYDQAKTSGTSAGKISQTPSIPGREMENFAVYINVAANSTAMFQLTYQEVIKRKLGQFQQKIHVEPMQIVPNLSLSYTVEEPEGIRALTYILPNQTQQRDSSSSAVDIRATPKKREIEFRPTIEQQRTFNKGKGIMGDFVISYDVNHQDDGGIVLVHNGYFVHYFSPSGLETLPKNIIFVIDISGSMGGFKIAKVGEVMHIILGKLRKKDYFNILLFDDRITLWQSKPQKATASNIEVARGYAKETLVARGSTNINSALLDAVDLLLNLQDTQDSRGKIIVFLTDGHPTAGETNPKNIQLNVKRKNEGLASIFALGFGHNVDMSFLEGLAYENGGFARKIYEERDAAEQLETFYEEISTPLLVDVQMEYTPTVVLDGDVTERKFPQYFNGSELVVAGKLRKNSPAEWQAKVIAEGESGQSSGRLEFITTPKNLLNIPGVTTDFAERYWAFSRIKELLKMELVAENEMQKNHYHDLALNLSLSYQFVTPLTSMVVSESVHAREESLTEKSLMMDAFALSPNRKVPGGKVHVYAQSVDSSGQLTYRFDATVLCLIFVVITRSFALRFV